MPKQTQLDQSFVQRVAAGIRYAVQGVTPSDWMTPAQPLQPVAQQAAEGRAMDYPVGFNARIRPKQEATGSVTFDQLRALADNLDILRLVIETRKDQVCAYEWEIQGEGVSDAVLADVRAKFLQPSPDCDWDGFLRKILEDLFVLDAVAVYPRRTVGGDLYSLEVIDAATIKRVIDATGRTPLPPSPAYQQILKGVPAADYTSESLIYAMRNPRSWRLYGFSPVEQIMLTANIALRRQAMQLSSFTDGNIPASFASVPESWNPDQIADFQNYFDSIMSGNQVTRSKMKFIPLDTAKIKESQDVGALLKGQFDEWLARIVCYAFSVSPTPFVAQVNRATAESAQDSAISEGLLPLLQFLKRLMDKIIRQQFGLDGVEFHWKMQAVIDPLVQAQIDQINVAAGIMSADEIRQARGVGDAPV